MRAISVFGLLLTISACSAEPRDEKIERLEMRLSGWSSIDVVIDNQGRGQYEMSEPFPEGKRGKFLIDRDALSEILVRLEPYRKESIPFSEKSVKGYVERSCREGVPEVTDAGAFYARWVTQNTDRHYLADFGCDYKRYADRTRDIMQIVKTLPVPVEW